MEKELRYVPFVKAKQNEIRALAKLDSKVFPLLIPFLDIPRPQNGSSLESKERIDAAKKNIIAAYKKQKFPFYIDVFDLPFNTVIEGKHPYDYLLGEIDELNYIPVVGLDRDDEHVEAVLKHRAHPDYVAIRLVDDDLLSFNLTSHHLKQLMSKFPPETCFDIILDNRLLLDKDIGAQINNCVSMINGLIKFKNVEALIVTGSSIPPVITDLVDTQSQKHFERLEWEIWSQLRTSYSDMLVFGDYTVISPEYSDANIPVELMRTTQTPRVIYSEKNRGFITRGGALKTHGDHQYFDLAKHVVSCGFFRSMASVSDIYLENVSNKNEKKKVKGGGEVAICGSPSKWIEVTVGSHISFMLSVL